VKPMAIGRLTQVFRKGMTSAPEPGAVTTRTSFGRFFEVSGGFWREGRRKEARG
jgi:hypothetical protein